MLDIVCTQNVRYESIYPVIHPIIVYGVEAKAYPLSQLAVAYTIPMMLNHTCIPSKQTALKCLNFRVPAYTFYWRKITCPLRLKVYVVGHCASRVFIIRFEFCAYDYHTISALLGEEKCHEMFNKNC